MGNLYVFCPRKSGGALELVKSLDAVRLRKFDGIDFWDKKSRVKIPVGSSIVVWGGILPELDSIRTLNSHTKSFDKGNELAFLQAAKVNTVKLLVPDGSHNQKDYIKAGYLPRVNNHVGGADLLFGTQAADFYTLKETFDSEIRLHIFGGRSIRAGIKIPREGFMPVEALKWRSDSNLTHPWIRSFDGGWRIMYDNFKSTPEQRLLATKAVKALGLTFGAVDIGIKGEGKSLVVLEVNSAPGLEGGTIEAYSKAITRWYKGAKEAVEVDE